jgi:hypothetical protein
VDFVFQNCILIAKGFGTRADHGSKQECVVARNSRTPKPWRPLRSHDEPECCEGRKGQGDRQQHVEDMSARKPHKQQTNGPSHASQRAIPSLNYVTSHNVTSYVIQRNWSYPVRVAFASMRRVGCAEFDPALSE